MQKTGKKNSVILTNKKKVYDILKKRIFRGFYTTNQQIRIANAANEFNVSQTPVREALIQLSAEGLIDFVPYSGAVVKGLSKDEVKQIFTIRIILECAAMKIGIPNLTESDLSRAEKIILNARNEVNPSKLSEINHEFHNVFYEKSNLPILCEMINSLYFQVDRYLRVYYSFVDIDYFVNHHLSIVVACRKDDPKKATEIMENALGNTASLIYKYITRTEME